MRDPRIPLFALSDILDDQAIETHFQAVSSIRRATLLGIEALSRGRLGAGQLISPDQLFAQAKREGRLSELDHFCLTRSVRAFAPFHRQNPELILFVNLHPETLWKEENRPDSLTRLTQSLEIDPRTIVLEVLESESENPDRLRETFASYRRQGFLIALDDVGVGYSNLDRITQIRPDILKIDRSLIQGLHQDYYKQQIFRGLVSISEKIGGWTVTEGVESQEEALAALALGGDLLQGFYFGRPHAVTGNGTFPDTSAVNWESERVQETALQFKRHTLDRLHKQRGWRTGRREITEAVRARLQNTALDSFEDKLREIIAAHPEIESACILNQSGRQITETILNVSLTERQKTIIFRPPPKGSSHSWKEYFYVPMELQRSGFADPAELFESPPYVPLPTGDICVTVSAFFHDARQECVILCLHLLTSAEEMLSI